MHDLTRRQVLHRGVGLAAAGLTIPSLMACGDDDDAEPTGGGARETRTVNHQLGWLHGVEWGGTYLAIENGYHREEGLDVKLSPGGPQTNAESRLAGGRSEIGIVYGVGVALANKEGANIKILASHLQKSPSGIVSLSEDPIAAPADMSGKRIGVPTNSVAAMDAFLDATGVPKEEVEYVPVQENLSPLTNDEVDGFYTYFTEVGPLEEQGIPYEFIFRSDFSKDDMSDMIGATQQTIDEDRDLVVRFLRAEIRGWQAFVEDPTPAIGLAVDKYGKSLGLKTSEQRFQADRYVDLVGDDPIVEEKGVLWLNDKIKEGILAASAASGAPLDDKVFDESLLEDAYGGKTRL